MVVAVSMLYLPPSEGEFCVKIKENAQISKAKYLGFFSLRNVSLCLKIWYVKVLSQLKIFQSY